MTLAIWMELFGVDMGKITQAIARELNDILRKIEDFERYKGGSGKLSFGKIYGNQRVS